MLSAKLTLILPGRMPGKVDEMPALSALLRNGQCMTGMDGHGVLAQSLGLKQQIDWPLAAVLADQAGLPAGKGFWLCADPVHLEAGMNGLILHPLGRDAPSPQEAQILALEVKEELARAWPECRLHPSETGRWFLYFEAPFDVSTQALSKVFHLGVRECWPAGRDAPALTRVMNIVQMRLHTHPINQVREQEGRLTINSIWFWGGGVFEPRGPGPDQILGDDDVVADLIGPIKAPFPQKLPTLRGNVLAIAPTDWSTLEAHWFRPLLSRLRWGRLQLLRLAFVDLCVELTPWDMWRPLR